MNTMIRVSTLVLLLCSTSVANSEVLSLEANRSVYSNSLNKLIIEKSKMVKASFQVYSDGLADARVFYVKSSNLDGVKAVDRAVLATRSGNVIETPFTTNLVFQYREREKSICSIFDKSKLSLLDLYQKSLSRTLRVAMESNDLSAADLIDSEIKLISSEIQVISSRNPPKTILTDSKPVKQTVKLSHGVVGIWKRTEVRKLVKDSLFVLNKDGSFQSDSTDPGWWKTYENGNRILLEWTGSAGVRKFVFSSDKNSFTGVNSSPVGLIEETFTFVKEIP